MVGTNRLMIMFDAKNLQLKQWTVHRSAGARHHGRGLQSRLRPKKPDPNLFVINYQPDPRSQMPHR